MKHTLLITSLLIAAAICFFGADTSPDKEYQPQPYNFTYSEVYGEPLIPADNPLTVEGVWLGRLLFYDSILSINGKMACASCHQQKLYFSDGLPVAIGVHGDTLKRHTISLVNLAWEKYFFWDGRDTTLEEVARDHINNPLEMGGLNDQELISRLKAHSYYPALFKQAFPKDSVTIANVYKAIAQFTRIIVLNFKAGVESFKDRGNVLDSTMINGASHAAAVARIGLMQCKTCHGKTAGGQELAVYSDDSVYKAPSWVNITHVGPYMHDGRYKTLEEVFKFYNANLDSIKAKNPHLLSNIKAPMEIKLTDYDFKHINDMFLSMTSASITTNPDISNPFTQKGFTWYGTTKKENPGH